MGEFSIEKLTQTVKKKPVLVIGGVVLAIGAGVVMASRSGGGGLNVAAAPYEIPEETGSGGGDVLDPALLDLLSNMLEREEATAESMSYLNNTLTELMDQDSYNYQSRYDSMGAGDYINTPTSIMEDTGDVAGMISLITSTPSFTTADRDYSLNQVRAIADWAENEQESINSGSSGTTKNPVGLGDANLIMEMHETGHVSFRTKGSTPTPTPKIAAPGPAGDAYRLANDPTRIKTTQDAVKKVTGKSGNVEQQLSGMSQSQKIDTLKKAGVY